MRRTLAIARRRAGFTLLEVMIAMGILALAFVAIGTTTSTSIIGSAKVYRMTTAAMLMRGIILDIEEEYTIEGFPTNDLEGKDCEVPDAFEDDFECEYDLEGMLFEEGQLESIAAAAMAEMTGGQDPMAMMAGMKGGGARGADGAEGLPGAETISSMLDPSAVPALALLLSPGGEELAAMCNINLAGLLMSVMGITQFFPQIVQKASEQTRKLTVRLKWKEGRRHDRELMVETFIVAIPEEQEELMKALGKAEEQGLLDGGQGGVPGQPGAGGAGGAADPARGGGGGGGGR
jgi:prepilin-type N-terminal cleavage/methylation domain-containing protein